ncbi:undecaprenyl-diphosphatase UppP [Candidatus Saccharibacteria bacterium]|nr:undecaprenyl-diphosphatase UppP [Candidatus Saccharibacteria bacterium]
MLLIVIILSIIQGITEFLPISSSAHLLLVPWVFNLTDPGLAFDAAIHIGTALALLVFFGKEFWVMVKKKDKLLWYIIAASVPAAIIGFFGDKFIEKYLHASSFAPLIVGIGMIVFSLLLYYVDRVGEKNEGVEKITLKQSLIVGFAQVLAFIPGASRSGITITAGLWLGFKREDAARFSFLLATPISLGAGLYKAYELVKHPSQSLTNFDLIVGIVVTFIVGIVVIKWLLDYLKKHSMLVFVIYRAVVGLLVVGLWLIRR